MMATRFIPCARHRPSPSPREPLRAVGRVGAEGVRAGGASAGTAASVYAEIPPTPDPSPPRAKGAWEEGSAPAHDFTISPHRMREVCIYFSPSESKGRGECRATDAPDSHVCDG